MPFTLGKDDGKKGGGGRGDCGERDGGGGGERGWEATIQSNKQQS